MTTTPVRPRALTAQAAALAVSLMDAAGADGTTLPASEIKVGTPLEAPAGPDSTHLFPFGTSGAEAVTPYLLVHVLPVSCGAVRTADGTWRVELDQPISAYVASGALRLFEVSE